MLSIKPLPWEQNTLEPYISSETIHFHYDCHYKNYINKTNELLQSDSSNLNVKSLTDIIKNTKNENLFNNAAQAWNHEFFWNSITPLKPSLPDKIQTLIVKSFDSIDNFYNEFSTKSKSHFGSGWCWLVLKGDNSLGVYTTKNADNPLKSRDIPLLTLDLWEHSYYIDYRNKKDDYVSNFLQHLINWDFINENLKFIENT